MSAADSVVIADYAPRWPAEFAAIAARLRAQCGAAALRIDHIGSTAVPGLCSKDVIDIQISVDSLAAGAALPLAQLAYVAPPGVWRDHRPVGASGPDTDWAKLFFTAPPGARRVHIHVRVAGRPNQRFALLFRDFLVVHPPFAAAYGRLKQALAHALPDEDVYADTKDPAVDLIHLAATEWAERVAWKPAASDA